MAGIQETKDVLAFVFSLGKATASAMEDGDIGFLLPSDGDADDLYFSAIDMGELTRISNYSKAKHMLFLVDACYGGLAAMNTRSLSATTPNLKN